MATTQSDGPWLGKTCFVFLIPGAILILSVATFALAMAYARALMEAALNARAIQYRRKGPSHTWVHQQIGHSIDFLIKPADT